MYILYIGKNTVLSKQDISFNVHNDSIGRLQKKNAQQLPKINELFVSNDRYVYDQSLCKPSKKHFYFWTAKKKRIR